MRAIFASIAVSLLLGCGPTLHVNGNGVMSSEQREVAGTKSVRLAVPGALVVTIGSPMSLRIDAEENLLPYLESRVSFGELLIGQRWDVSVTTTRAMHFELTVPELSGLAITTSGSITAPALSATGFTLNTSSSGTIHLARLDATTLDTRISSAGSITVDEGKVTTQTLSLSSSGDFVAGGLESARATAHLSSSGNAVVWVTERLEATLSSSGNLRYVGTPQVITHLSSSGRVLPVDN